MHDGDVPPDLEMRRDGVVGSGVVVFQELQRAIGEHHAEAEGRIRAVLLDEADLRLGTAPLQQIGEIEPGRPGAEDGDLHQNLSSSCPAPDQVRGKLLYRASTILKAPAS